MPIYGQFVIPKHKFVAPKRLQAASLASLSWSGCSELNKSWVVKNTTGSTANCNSATPSLLHPLARRLALQGIRAPPEGPFCFWLNPHWQGKLLLLLREAVSCCCCCPVFATNPGLAALSGPHCSLRRPRPPLPHSPCTEGGWGGKNLPFLPCLPLPLPPLPGMLGEVEACLQGSARGRQAGLQAGLCKPAGPSRLHLAARLKWPPTRGWGCNRVKGG